MGASDTGMRKETFNVEVTRDLNGFFKAAAVDEMGREIDNFIAQTRAMALLGLKEQLLLRYAPKEKVVMEIDVPDEGV